MLLCTGGVTATAAHVVRAVVCVMQEHLVQSWSTSAMPHIKTMEGVYQGQQFCLVPLCTGSWERSETSLLYVLHELRCQWQKVKSVASVN